MGSIYKITNTVNQKHYIGQTIHDAEKTRIRDHFNYAYRSNIILSRAIEKYGKDAFTHEILHDGIIPALLDSYEIEAIKKFNTVVPNGYKSIAEVAGISFILNMEAIKINGKARGVISDMLKTLILEKTSIVGVNFMSII